MGAAVGTAVGAGAAPSKPDKVGVAVDGVDVVRFKPALEGMKEARKMRKISYPSRNNSTT